MKAVIFAGGFGTRISEESKIKPKPMVEIGGKPILWHIMKIYSHHGIKDFVVCLGYKGHYIKEWFDKFDLHRSDAVIFDFKNNLRKLENKSFEDWRVTLVETGEDTSTGGRLRKVKDYLDDDTFMLTYGDGVADIDVTRLLKAHKEHGKIATMTSIVPKPRFGTLDVDENNRVSAFREKKHGGSRINGGFFVLEPAVFKYLNDDKVPFEHAPLENLVKDKHLFAYCHDGFWMPMDTLNDKNVLEGMWKSGDAPWKIWSA
jgi:glucose-1-phosphate cytidylyltransferase